MVVATIAVVIKVRAGLEDLAAAVDFNNAAVRIQRLLAEAGQVRLSRKCCRLIPTHAVQPMPPSAAMIPHGIVRVSAKGS